MEIVDYHEKGVMSIHGKDLKNTDFSDIVVGEEKILIPPGVFLKEILEEFDLSQAEFAEAAGISPMRVSHVINGTRPITADLALRFGRVLGQPPQYWISLQSTFELEKAERSIGSSLSEIRPLKRG